jgi:nitroreductase
MEFMKALYERQSTRKFQKTTLSQGQIEIILKAGQAAPIGRKLFENLHITVVKNAEALVAIKAAAVEATGKPEANPLYDAPVLFLVSAKEADQPVNIANAAVIVENMHLQATEQFLGSCFLMGIMFNGTLAAPGLKGKLGIPEGFSPVAGLVVGYPHGYLIDREPTLDKISYNIVE